MIFIFLTFKQKKISSEEHKSQKNLKMLHNNHKKYLMCKIISTNNSFKESHKNVNLQSSAFNFLGWIYDYNMKLLI